MSVIEYLKQDVEHIRMCLLDLIEKDHGVRISADLLTELSALLVTNISWRRSDHLGDAVFLHILRHINPDQCILSAKHGFGQRFAKFGFSDPSRSQE